MVIRDEEAGDKASSPLYRTNRLARSCRFAMNLILEKQEAENEDFDLA